MNIYDPLTGAPAERQQFANNVIPTARLSPQAQRILALIPLPNAPGRDNGTRDNYVASDSETFNEDSFNVRIDGRLGNGANTFGRYSRGKFLRDGPTAFGAGRRPRAGQPRRRLGRQEPEPRLRHRLRAVDARCWPTSGSASSATTSTCCRSTSARRRRPTRAFPGSTSTPASPRACPPATSIATATAASSSAPASTPTAATARSIRTSTSSSSSATSRSWPAATRSRRASTCAARTTCACRATRTDPASSTFSPNRTRGVDGGLGLATFLLGDVTSFGRFVSTSTDAREQQWRHFYYAQDTWRASPKLTLNYGLRLDVINPQTVNEAGNGGFLDLTTGEILVAGVGGIGLNGNVENTFNWAPRLGATYQLTQKTVLRAGFGRSYDIGVFGSLFGHAVTQNLPVLSNQNINAPNNFDAVFNLAQGPPAPVFPAVPSNGRFPLPNGSGARALTQKQQLPTVDAWNVTVQHQLTDTLSVEAAYVGNRGSHAFFGDGPAANANQPSLVGFAQGVSTNLRRPFFAGNVANAQGFGGAFGWTQGFDYFCNCATNLYNSLQTKATKRFGGGYSLFAQYTLQQSENNDGELLLHRSRREPRHRRTSTGRTRSRVSTVAEIPVGRGKTFLSDVSRAVDVIVGGWQFNQNTMIQSGFPFNVSYRNAGQDRDTGPEPART